MAKYRQIAESGKCPFCEPYIENERRGTTEFWNIVLNQFPYKNARLHWLILPKRHVTELTGLTIEEWSDLYKAITKLETDNQLPLCNGYGVGLRTGPVGGVTLHHLHWHVILPEAGESGVIPVNFGIG